MATQTYHSGGECTAKDLRRQCEAAQTAWKKSKKQREADQLAAMRRQGIKTKSLLDIIRGK